MSNSPTAPARRLFFALWPDDESRSRLGQVIRNLPHIGGGQPVPVQNLHVTLAFLGATQESGIAEIMSVAQRVADELPLDPEPLRMSFDRVEYWQRPQILCATAGSQPPDAANSLDRLAERLKSEALNAGFTPDLQAFRAHVTLARKIRHADDAYDIEPVVCTFTDFSLVGSRNSVSGPKYNFMGKWPLGRAALDASSHPDASSVR